jgi:anti-sigma B factor antagonist
MLSQPGSPALHVQSRGEVTVATVTGKVLGGCETEGIRELLGKGLDHRSLYLDLARVDFVTASGLGDLVALHKRLQAVGGRLTVCNVRSEALSVFRLTGLSQVLHIERGRGTA